MPGEYDQKFDEIKGLLSKTVEGVDELRLEMRDLRSEVGDNSTRLQTVEERLSLISSQFNDVGRMAIKDSGRIDDHEKRISDLEANIH
jgi:archaellum component FlaC